MVHILNLISKLQHISDISTEIMIRENMIFSTFKIWNLHIDITKSAENIIKLSNFVTYPYYFHIQDCYIQ